MKKTFLFLLILSFLLPFVLYLFTLYPGLTFTDNGELASACASLGIAHPTGYPLFTILGHLWTYLPISNSIIFELNIFSAFLTALSASVFFLIINLVIGRFNPNKLSESNINILSFVGALFYASGSVTWAQGTSLEVYSLHLLLINIALYCFLRGDFSGERKYILLGAFSLGLSFSNHLTTILVIPALTFLHFYKPNGWDFKKSNFTNAFVPSILLLIGLSLYLYLPLRSAQDPLFDWGDVSRSWDKFIYHITGSQYQVWMFSDREIFVENLGKFWNILNSEIGIVYGHILLFLGIIFTFKINKRITVFFLLLIFTCIIYSSGYTIHDIDTYYLLAFTIIKIFIILGISLSAGKYLKKYFYIILILPLILMFSNFTNNNHSEDRIVPTYINILTENIEENSIIISSEWDFWVSGFWYNQQIEGMRKDIILIEKELLRRTWYPAQLLKWYPELGKCKPEIDSYMIQLELFESKQNYDPRAIQANFEAMLNSFIDKFSGDKNIYLTLDVMKSMPEVGKNYLKIPQGFAFLLSKDKNSVYPVEPRKLNLDQLINQKRENPNHLELGIMQAASLNLVNLGRYADVTGQKDSARKCFEIALELEGTNQFAIESLGKSK
jgi:Protein O-mannosyl-transferase TMEM260-like